MSSSLVSVLPNHLFLARRRFHTENKSMRKANVSEDLGALSCLLRCHTFEVGPSAHSSLNSRRVGYGALGSGILEDG
jgi:hypothetical protein